MNISVGEILKLENDKEYICIAVDKYKDAKKQLMINRKKLSLWKDLKTQCLINKKVKSMDI